MICALLKRLQEAFDMVSVRRSVMTGDGQGHQDFASPFIIASCLHGRKTVGLISIGMNNKAAERNPGNAGYRIGILRRRRVILAQHPVIVPETRLVVQIRPVKASKSSRNSVHIREKVLSSSWKEA